MCDSDSGDSDVGDSDSGGASLGPGPVVHAHNTASQRVSRHVMAGRRDMRATACHGVTAAAAASPGLRPRKRPMPTAAISSPTSDPHPPPPPTPCRMTRGASESSQTGTAGGAFQAPMAVTHRGAVT